MYLLCRCFCSGSNYRHTTLYVGFELKLTESRTANKSVLPRNWINKKPIKDKFVKLQPRLFTQERSRNLLPKAGTIRLILQ